MSYRLKGQTIILEGMVNKIIAKALPSNPANGYICLDSVDNKFKVYHKNRWVVLGSVETEDDDVSVDANTETINFEDGFEVISEGGGKITLNVNSEGDPTGSLQDLVYSEQSTTANKYLSLSGAYNHSGIVPGIIQFKSDFIGFTFSNEQLCNIDIEVYKNGTDPGNKIYTYELRNKRFICKTNVPDVTVNSCDRISLYLKEVGGSKPKSPVVTLKFQIRKDHSFGEVSI